MITASTYEDKLKPPSASDPFGSRVEVDRDAFSDNIIHKVVCVSVKRARLNPNILNSIAPAGHWVATDTHV
jgi:hypothetical protein